MLIRPLANFLKRADNRLASTNTTNAIADVLQQLTQYLPSGIGSPAKQSFPIVVAKRTEPVSGRTGVFNYKTAIGDLDSGATGPATEEQLGELVADNDIISFELSALPGISVLLIVGEDQATGTPIAISLGRNEYNGEITDHDQDSGDKKRFTYQIKEIVKTAAGFDGWTELEDGYVGPAYCLNESNNGATGTYGNGVNSSNLIGSMTLKPFPNGTRIRFWFETFSAEVEGSPTTVREAWFEITNAIDGACE